jgi:CRP/FNR family transcriptional regulator, cyclic AMP receptor protein
VDFTTFFNYPDSESEAASEDFSFLPTWSPQDWDKLLQHTQTQMWSEGDIVVSAGETERALHLVHYGTLEVLMPVAGRLVAITTIAEGSVLGEQTFLDGKPRSATIRATEESQTLYLDLSAFEIFAAKEAELARLFLFDLGRILSLRLRQTTILASQLRK